MSVKSADRLLDLLELFAECNEPLRLNDVAARLGYPTSSTAALLKSVSDKGYLSFNPTTLQYAPTNKLCALGVRFSRKITEGQFLSDLTNAVSRDTGELIVVGAPNDVYVEYILSVRSTRPIQLYSPPGTRRLLVQSGMGMMILSQLSDGMVRRIYRRTVAAHQISGHIMSEESLLCEVEATRGSEFLYTDSSSFVRSGAHPGGAIISMCIPTLPGQRELILGVGGPSERLERNIESILICMRREIHNLQGRLDCA